MNRTPEEWLFIQKKLESEEMEVKILEEPDLLTILSATHDIAEQAERIKDLEANLQDTLNMLQAAHMQCGVHHASNKRVIKVRTLLQDKKVRS